MCGCLTKVTGSKVKTFSKSVSSVSEPVCQDMYDELRQLDLLIIEILKVEKDNILREANKQIRFWIRNLHKGCPNEYEFEVIKQYIESEYSEYIT